MELNQGVGGTYLPWAPVTFSDGVTVVSVALFKLPAEPADLLSLDLKVRGLPIRKEHKVYYPHSQSLGNCMETLLRVAEQMIDQAKAELVGVV